MSWLGVAAAQAAADESTQLHQYTARHIAPKIAQCGLKTTNDGPNIAPMQPKLATRRPKVAARRPGKTPENSRDVSKTSKTHPRMAQDGFKTAQEDPRGSPRWLQGGLGRPSRPAEMDPRPSRPTSRRFKMASRRRSKAERRQQRMEVGGRGGGRRRPLPSTTRERRRRGTTGAGLVALVLVAQL
eukprot:5198848-Pyramimonas_sp.AAC.1